MCHENFVMDFGTHVNVVSGTNGSGKSAVLQALQACLGASARETGRGTNLAGFIRSGAPDAKVAVTLWNTGSDAFRPEQYGKQITVERKILHKGGGFKMLSERGKTVASKRDEVDAMLEHFGLNAGNALTVMTQDMCRQFLSGGVADRKKFELFMEGTMLDVTRENNAAARADTMAARQRLQETGVKLQAEKAEVDSLKERKAALDAQEQQGVYVEQLERAKVWLKVREVTGELERHTEAMAILPAKIERAEASVAEAEEAIGAAQADRAARTAAMAEVQQKTETFAAETVRLRQAQSAARKRVYALEARQKEVQTEADMAARNKEEVAKKMDESMNSDKRAEQRRALEEHERLVAAKKQEADAAVAAHLEATARHKELSGAAEAAQMAALEAEKELAWVQSQVADLERQQAQAIGAQRNKLVRFGGEPAKRLTALVKQQLGRFSAPPVGPLGAHLQLPDSRWSKAVESSIGGLLDTWMCNTMQDAQLLRQLAGQAGYPLDRFITVTTSFAIPAHAIPPGRLPREGFTSVMSLLAVDDPAISHVVMNFLVDRAHVESTVVADTAQAANDIIYKSLAGQAVKVSAPLVALAATVQLQLHAVALFGTADIDLIHNRWLCAGVAASSC